MGGLDKRGVEIAGLEEGGRGFGGEGGFIKKLLRINSVKVMKTTSQKLGP